MENLAALTPERIGDFLRGNAEIEFSGQDRAERYAWMQAVLVEQRYFSLGKKHRVEMCPRSRNEGLLQIADKQAARMATADRSGVCEIALHFPGPVLRASIRKRLNTLPTFVGDQRFVRARVRPVVQIEIAGVQPAAPRVTRLTAERALREFPGPR